MKKIILFFYLTIFLFSCNLNDPPKNNTPGKVDSVNFKRDSVPKVKQYSGLYCLHNSTFLNCDDGKLYKLKNAVALDSVYKAILPNSYNDQTIFIQINALINPMDPKAILFTSNVKAEQKSYKNTCIPYDFWCFGTEPFWQIQISEKENLIDFYDPMEQKTTHFIYSKPEIKDGITTYTSSDKKDRISIAIKKEKCNGAIDPQYDYSVLVTLNDKKYNGCASRP